MCLRKREALRWHLLNLNPVKLLLLFINIKGYVWKCHDSLIRMRMKCSNTGWISESITCKKLDHCFTVKQKIAHDCDHLEFAIRQASLFLLLTPRVKDLNKSPTLSIKLWFMNDISIFQLIGQKRATAFLSDQAYDFCPADNKGVKNPIDLHWRMDLQPVATNSLS